MAAAGASSVTDLNMKLALDGLSQYVTQNVGHNYASNALSYSTHQHFLATFKSSPSYQRKMHHSHLCNCTLSGLLIDDDDTQKIIFMLTIVLHAIIVKAKYGKLLISNNAQVGGNDVMNLLAQQAMAGNPAARSYIEQQQKRYYEQLQQQRMQQLQLQQMQRLTQAAEAAAASSSAVPSRAAVPLVDLSNDGAGSGE
jgi:hypothetical protein